MIIDLILDRKNGSPYNAREFYNDVMAYEEGSDYKISRALDGGSEKDVKKALCEYVMGEYNPKICNYINSVSWLEDDATVDELNNSLSMIDGLNDFLENEKVQRTIISSDYVRKQMISTLEKFIGELKGTVAEMKQLDKELKL